MAPASAAAGPAAYGGSGSSVRVDQLRRDLRAAGLEQGETGGGPAEPAGDRDDVAGSRARPQHRRAPLQVAERGHR